MFKSLPHVIFIVVLVASVESNPNYAWESSSSSSSSSGSSSGGSIASSGGSSASSQTAPPPASQSNSNSSSSDDGDASSGSSSSPAQQASSRATVLVASPAIFPSTFFRTVVAPETIVVHEPTVTKVGEIVEHIPTAVSHQSQTIVHNHARVVTPIVAPGVRTYTSQVLRAYHTPVVYSTAYVSAPSSSKH